MKRILIVFVVMALSNVASATSFHGKIIKVTDGDTVTVVSDGKQTKIRLYGVDAPEKNQAYGPDAKRFVDMALNNKTVRIEPVTTGKYGRTVAIVFGDKCLNEELVKAGYAWVYHEYCKRPVCDRWLEYEKEAKEKKLGLWQDKSPTPPWDFRHGKKASPDAADGKFHGNVNSKKFHAPGCKYYDCNSCTAVFDTRRQAIEAGYKPCGVCRKRSVQK
ncbi:MAG: nuclease [bacterium]|nr:nuclease [bacterium]